MSDRRTGTMGRVGAVLAVGALALAAAAPAAAQENVVEQIGYVAPEAATDYGWNEQGAAGATAAAESVGAELIMNDGAGYEDVTPVLNQLQEDGADFIIAQASGYNTAAPAFSAASGIPVIIFDDPGATTEGLVANVSTDSQEGGYLAGVLAANMTQTGQLGIVISADDVNWHKQAGGFVAGAQSVNPEIVFHQAQIGPADYANQEGGNQVTAAGHLARGRHRLRDGRRLVVRHAGRGREQRAPGRREGVVHRRHR